MNPNGESNGEEGPPPQGGEEEAAGEDFRAEMNRIIAEYGVPPRRLSTWEELSRWERWGRETDERLARLHEIERHHGAAARDEARLRMQLEYGVITQEDYRAKKERRRKERDLAELQRVLGEIVHDGRDPDEMYAGDPMIPNELRERHADWTNNRRPGLEMELDDLRERMKDEGYEPTETEARMIETLQDLREAEREARDHRELEP